MQNAKKIITATGAPLPVRMARSHRTEGNCDVGRPPGEALSDDQDGARGVLGTVVAGGAEQQARERVAPS
jgi:hypothetical protein